MRKLGLKEFLKEEIPEINCGLLKLRTMQQIRGYERKHAEQRLYAFPKIGMSFLLLLLAVNAYSLLQETLFYLDMRHIGFQAFLEMPFFSSRFLLRGIAVFGDNVFALLVNLSLILCLNKRFLGLYRAYRLVRARVATIKNFLVRIPEVAWALIRRS